MWGGTSKEKTCVRITSVPDVASYSSVLKGCLLPCPYPPHTVSEQTAAHVGPAAPAPWTFQVSSHKEAPHIYLHFTSPICCTFPNTHLSQCRDVKPLQSFAPMDLMFSSLRPPSSCVQFGGSDVRESSGILLKFFLVKGKLLQSFT